MQWLVFNHTMKSNFAMNDHLLPFSTAKKTDQVFYGVALYLKWKRLVLVVVNLEFFLPTNF